MLKDKEKRFKFCICTNIILATLIGIYAQDINYYIVGDSLARSSALYWLTILTLLSIVLFVSTPIFINIFIKKESLEKRVFNTYIIANGLIGILISIFSIFVLVMSWG